jgi:hypothetical protein
MSVVKEETAEVVNGEVAPQSLTGASIMLTPPSCAPGTPAPSPRFTATARFGDNRSGAGFWEYALSSTASGQYPWGTPGVPLDSGPVALDLTVDAGQSQSQATFSIGTGAPVALNATPYTKIDSVGVRVEDTRQSSNQTVLLRAEWLSLDITFFDDADRGYSYPGLATQVCPMPFFAQTPPPPSFGTTQQTRIILPGTVQGTSIYPVRMTLNGSIRLSSSAAPELISAQQLVTKVLVWAS